MVANSFVKVDSSSKTIVNGNVLNDKSMEVLGINGEVAGVEKNRLTGETNIIKFPHVENILYPNNNTSTITDPLTVLKMFSTHKKSSRSRTGTRARSRKGTRARSRKGTRARSRKGTRARSRTNIN